MAKRDIDQELVDLADSAERHAEWRAVSAAAREAGVDVERTVKLAVRVFRFAAKHVSNRLMIDQGILTEYHAAIHSLKAATAKAKSQRSN